MASSPKGKPRPKKVAAVGFDLEPFRDLVVFDLETTGLSPQRDEIIQIAAIRLRDGRIVEEDAFFSYVRPERPIPPFIASYTGVTERHVADAPLAPEVLVRFSEYCADSLLVAHNGKSFDTQFFEAACARHRLTTRETHALDSMHLSWCLWGRVKGVSHSLDNVIARLGVPQHDIRRHDARGDVLVTARCLREMVARLSVSGPGLDLSLHGCLLPSLGQKTRGRTKKSAPLDLGGLPPEGQMGPR